MKSRQSKQSNHIDRQDSLVYSNRQDSLIYSNATSFGLKSTQNR